MGFLQFSVSHMFLWLTRENKFYLLSNVIASVTVICVIWLNTFGAKPDTGYPAKAGRLIWIPTGYRISGQNIRPVYIECGGPWPGLFVCLPRLKGKLTRWISLMNPSSGTVWGRQRWKPSFFYHRVNQNTLRMWECLDLLLFKCFCRCKKMPLRDCICTVYSD